MDWLIKAFVPDFSKLSSFGLAITILNYAFTLAIIILFFHQGFHMIISFFVKGKKYPKSEVYHKFAYIICAHDEEKVIGNLIDSIHAQDYPKELMKIFVVCDNCSDHTYDICISKGVTPINHMPKENEIGKSYALDFMLKKLVQDYDSEGFDAVLFFDADNLVGTDFTKRMNDAYSAGERACMGYRDGKNFDASWIAAASAMSFHRECTLLHPSRSIIGMGTAVTGTGFYLSYDIVKQMNGYPYHTLIEDIELSINLSRAGERIAFCYDAIYYDEQPETFKGSWIQRVRWVQGMYQCCIKYNFKEIGKAFKKPSLINFELYAHCTPSCLLALLWPMIYILLTCIDVLVFTQWLGLGATNWNDVAWISTSVLCSFIGYYFLFSMFQAAVVILKKGKQIRAPRRKKFLSIFGYGVFMVSYIPIAFAALFAKKKWKKVEHNSGKTIEDLNNFRKDYYNEE